MGSERLRIGIIGCGEIAAATAKGIQEAEHAKIAAVMDTNEAPAEDLGRMYDVPWTTDAAELQAHSDLDRRLHRCAARPARAAHGTGGPGRQACPLREAHRRHTRRR